MNRDAWLAKYAPSELRGSRGMQFPSWGPGQSPVSFGTLFGDHTIEETRDLVRAKSDQLAQMRTQRARLSSPPDATWDSDFAALQSRFKRAVDAFGNGDSNLNPLRTSEDDYQAILHALAREPNFVQTGDAQDLFNRLAAQPGTVFTPLPQPTAKDLDLAAYSAVDSQIKTLEKTADAAKKAAGDVSLSLLKSPIFWIGLALVGGVAYIGLTKASPLALL